jgi:hypothetical protein
MDDASDICRNGNQAKQNEGQPPTIMKERSSGRNCGWQHATIMATANAALTEPERGNCGKPVWFRRARGFFAGGAVIERIG